MRGPAFLTRLAAVGVGCILTVCISAEAQTCDTPLICPVPSPGNSCISGQLYEMETGDLVRAASPSGDPCAVVTADGPCSVEVEVFDALGFYQNPSGTPPLPADIVVDDCGFYRVSNFPNPALGFVAVAADDASGPDDLVQAAISMGISPGAQIDGTPLYAFRVTTDQAWTDSAGDPFVGQTFSERGVVVGIFFNDDEPAPGVVLTRIGAAQPSDDYYFDDLNPFDRSNVNPALTSTGTNGTALMVDSGLEVHGGIGGATSGCEWPTHLAKSIPGVAVVQEFYSVDSSTGEVCLTRIFSDGFENGNTNGWSSTVG